MFAKTEKKNMSAYSRDEKRKKGKGKGKGKGEEVREEEGLSLDGLDFGSAFVYVQQDDEVEEFPQEDFVEQGISFFFFLG